MVTVWKASILEEVQLHTSLACFHCDCRQFTAMMALGTMIELQDEKLDKAPFNDTAVSIGSENEQENCESHELPQSKVSVAFMVLFSALAIGSDGFNFSIIGNLSLILAVVYPSITTTEYSRLSNAFAVGMIVGMLGFGYICDRLGRKGGAVLTTLILVVGIALSAGSSGKSQSGMVWMLVISRGIAGVGAGG